MERWSPRARGGCDGQLVFDRCRVCVLQDEKRSGGWPHKDTTEPYA